MNRRRFLKSVGAAAGVSVVRSGDDTPEPDVDDTTDYDVVRPATPIVVDPEILNGQPQTVAEILADAEEEDDR